MRLRFRTETWNVEVLVKAWVDGRIVLPLWQRPFQWNMVRKEMFIESLLMHYPIPPIYLLEEGESMVLIDGHQRIRTIIEFMEDAFPITLSPLASQAVGAEVVSLKYSMLPERVRRRLLMAPIAVVVAETDDPSLKYDLFVKLNRGALKLTTYDIAYAYSWHARPALAELTTRLAQDPEWLGLLRPNADDERKRMPLALTMVMLATTGVDFVPAMSGSTNSVTSLVTEFYGFAAERVEPDVRELERRFREDVRGLARAGVARRHLIYDHKRHKVGGRLLMKNLLLYRQALRLAGWPEGAADRMFDVIERNVALWSSARSSDLTELARRMAEAVR